MLVNTKAIILHTLPFKETSIIIYAYSKENGRISFIANGVRKTKSKLKLNIFQPLSLVDIIYYSKNTNELCRIKEAKRSEIFSEIPFRIDKNSIAAFIAEFIYKVIREEDKNEPLFEFLNYSILLLDKADNNISIFNLIFLLQLTKYVGIIPDNNYSDSNIFFNLNNGFFTSTYTRGISLDKYLSNTLQKLLSAGFKELELISIPKKDRKELLEKLILYYQIHLDYSVTIKSIKILEEVFNT